uniref:ATP synthase subunit a n=1 Tax=Kumanoa mahlacensis TaxID=1196387 RepID=A0A343UXY2_9FLOR|nr:ATP synthase F0 subunit 6 [Kumanoa mahlacensis]AVK39539.1 ATP synthase F0 subunit 6 [Kumanoa mahlacensis]UEQ11845.1 ATP synthase F0 subunit 6 [Kumanoa mahlacensis]
MILFIASPLEQFEIITILPLNFLGLNFSVTNSTVFLLLSSVIIVFLLNLSFYKVSLVPASLQSIKEVIYEVTSSMIRDNLGSKGEKFFPFIFTLHLLLLTCNLVGMVPYSFTVTSHIIFTFSLALSIFIGINIVGFKTHGIKFFSLFLPRGVPLFIVPLLVTIEFISYIIKVFTLSIRLFANMTSGHTLLKIIASFAWTMLSAGGLLAIFHIIPLGLLIALIGLELGIAGLQAYVFTLLTCIYLNDVLDMH